MSEWFESFEELYDFFDYEEANFDVCGYRYLTEQYANDEHPRLIHLMVIDYDRIPKGEYIFDPKYTVEERDFENSVELINNYKFADGRTLAERTCDELGLDRSILPVYPKWYDPLFGDIDPPKDDTTDEEWQKQLKEMEEDTQRFWEEERAQALAEGDLEDVAEFDRIDSMTEEELQKECEQYTRELNTKK